MLKTFADKGETPTDKEGNPIRLNAAYHPERLENDETRTEILAQRAEMLRNADELPTDDWHALCQYYNRIHWFGIPDEKQRKHMMAQMDKWLEH